MLRAAGSTAKGGEWRGRAELGHARSLREQLELICLRGSGGHDARLYGGRACGARAHRRAG